METYADTIRRLYPAQESASDPNEISYRDIILEMKRREDEARALTLHAAAQGDPDTAARALGHGLPVDVDPSLLGEADRSARAAATRKRLESSPLLSSWMQDMANAAVAYDDVRHLSTLERGWKKISTEFDAGYATNELGFTGTEVMALGFNNERRGRVDALRQRLDAGDHLKTGNTFFDSFAGPAARMVGQQAEGVFRRAGAAAAGAGVALVAGQLGPQVAAPEELVTVPTAAYYGWMAESAVENSAIEAGMAWLEMNDIRGANGERLDPTTQTGVALGVGLVNGALEFVGARAVAAPFMAVFKKQAASEVQSSLLKTFGKSYARAVATETTTEVMQEVVNILGEETVKALSQGKFDTLLTSPAEREQAIERILGIAAQTAGGMALLGLPGAGVSTFSQSRANRAQANAAALAEAAEAAAQSALLQRDPARLQDLIQQIAADQGSVLLPAESVRELHQSGMISPEVLESWDVSGQLAEVLQTGGDLSISAEALLTSLAGLSPEQRAEVVHRIRLAPGEMTGIEAEAFLGSGANPTQNLDALLERLQQQEDAVIPGQRIQDDVAQSLRAAGLREEEAHANATLITERVRRRAQDRGMDPEALWQEERLTVLGPTPQAARLSRDSLDLVLARLKSGNTVSTARTPVLDILKRKGGIAPQGRLAAELATLGISPRTAPGLFRHGGLTDADTLVVSEHEALRDNALAEDGNGYADQNALMEAIANEWGGNPLLTNAEQERIARLDAPVEDLRAWLEEVGIDPATVTKEQVLRLMEGSQTEQGALFQTAVPPAGSAFAKDVGRWLDLLKKLPQLPSTHDIRMGHTPPALRTLGLPKLPLTMLAGKIGKAHKDHPNVPRQVWNNLPALLADPLYVFDSGKGDGSVIVVLNARTKGAPIIVPILPNGTNKQGHASNVVLSIYDKETSSNAYTGDQWIADSWSKALSQGKTVYSRDGASPAGGTSGWSNSSRPTLSRSTNAGSRGKILTRADVVKQHGDVFYQPSETGPVRGSFDPATDTIRLFQAANASTFLHESGHLFLFQMARDLGDARLTPEARSRITSDLQAVFDHLGVTLEVATASSEQILEALTVEQHETFARTVEAYVMEGKAPSLALRATFQRLSAWLVGLYRKIRHLNVQMTPEIRGVMDRLLASEDAIAKARAARGFSASPALTAALDQAATPAEQAHLRDLNEQAAQEALHQLQGRVMRELTRQRKAAWREERAALRDSIAAEARNRPVYAALNLLLRGENPDGSRLLDENGVARKLKLDRAALIADFGEEIIKALPRGISVAKDGVNPHLFAGIVGFRDADEMCQALMNLEPFDAMVKREADAAMLQRHGDLLQRGRIAEEAAALVLNQKQGALLALQEKLLHRLAQQKTEDNAVHQPPLDQAALEETARRFLAARPVELATQPQRYRAQALRLMETIQQATSTQDYATAAESTQRLRLNLVLEHQAREAAHKVEKAGTRFKRLNKSDAVLASNTDIDFARAARAVLAKYGLARPDSTFALNSWLEQFRAADPAGAADIQAVIDTLAALPAQNYRKLAYADFLKLVEGAEALLYQGRRAREVEIEGKTLDIEAVVDELVSQTQLHDDGQRPGTERARTNTEKRWYAWQSIKTALTRVESWTQVMDDGAAGPFTRLLFRPVQSQIYAYRAARKETMEKLYAILAPLKRELGRPRTIHAPELNYTFQSLGDVLHFILHNGNESNLRKLTLAGRGEGHRWGTRTSDGGFDASRVLAFRQRLFAQGIITKEHMDAALGVWDLLESMKPAAQQAHRAMYGFYFEEIEPTPIETPWGTYRGGYIPALTESALAEGGTAHEDMDALLGSANATMFPAAERGFTRSRVENYTQPLALNLMLLPGHIDKVLRFTHLGPAVKQAARIARNRAVVNALHPIDPHAIEGMIIPWLNRVARQQADTPSTGAVGRWLDGVARALRRNVSLNAMALNVANALQQVLDLPAVLVKVKPRFVGGALVRLARDRSEMTQDIQARSAFMRDRLDMQAMEAAHAIEESLAPSTVIGNTRRFAHQHGYILQCAAQTAMDQVTWWGAYTQAIETGLAEDEASLEADSVVRRVQGSFAPEDAASIESGSPVLRLFTMFYAYFNARLNLLWSEMKIAQRTLGGADKAKHIANTLFFGFYVSALLSEALILAMRGDWDDEDDGWGDDLLALGLLAPVRFAGAMVPGGGQVANLAINLGNDKPYDDRLTVSPAGTLLESAVRAPHSLYGAVVDDKSASRALRDSSNALALAFGLPLNWLGKPLGYAADVAEGWQNPEDAADVLQGALMGRDGTR